MMLLGASLNSMPRSAVFIYFVCSIDSCVVCILSFPSETKSYVAPSRVKSLPATLPKEILLLSMRREIMYFLTLDILQTKLRRGMNCGFHATE